MERNAALSSDVLKVEQALIVLSGHLPLFVADKRKVARAETHLRLRDEAFDALDRIADAIDAPKPLRRLEGERARI